MRPPAPACRLAANAGSAKRCSLAAGGVVTVLPRCPCLPQRWCRGRRPAVHGHSHAGQLRGSPLEATRHPSRLPQFAPAGWRAAILLAILAILIAYALERLAGRWRGRAEALVELPYALPGIVLAIACILLFPAPAAASGPSASMQRPGSSCSPISLAFCPWR